MISVVMSTYQRGSYLDRSLHCYAESQLNVPLEIVVVDDGSSDDTEEVVDSWSGLLDITYMRLWKAPNLWRDCSSTINRGIRASRGDLIIATHPEVMPGRRSLQALWDAKQDDLYLACKVYYLTP